MNNNSNLPTPYRPWLAWMRRNRQQIVTGCLAAAGGGWVAFWLATSGLWYWCFQLVAPCMVIGITVRLIWSAIEDDAPHPEPGWQGEEMSLPSRGSSLVHGNPAGDPEKYRARDVFDERTGLQADELNPEWVANEIARMDRERALGRKTGPEFEVEG